MDRGSNDATAILRPHMPWTPHRIAIAAMTTMAACTEAEMRSTVSTSGDHFFDTTWPDDARTVDGRPDMQGFPQAAENELIREYMVEVFTLDGDATL